MRTKEEIFAGFSQDECEAIADFVEEVFDRAWQEYHNNPLQRKYELRKHAVRLINERKPR